MADGRLLVHGAAADGKPRPARTTWDSQRQRHEVWSLGTRVLGYVYPVPLTASGQRPKRRTGTYADALTGIPADSTSSTTKYQATGPNDEPYDDPVDSVDDAVALVVGAAHSDDPAPEHVVPRNVGGRPAIGQAINWRPGDDLLQRLDERAKRDGVSRADLLRRLVERGLVEF